MRGTTTNPDKSGQLGELRIYPYDSVRLRPDRDGARNHECLDLCDAPIVRLQLLPSARKL